MLIFNLASTDPAAFHLILCFAANDIAARSGRLDSEDAIKHRTAALSLVKKDVLACKSSDDFLAAVSTLAGHEVCSPLPAQCRYFYHQLTLLKPETDYIWISTDVQYPYGWLSIDSQS